MEVYCSSCCMKNGNTEPFGIFLSTGDLCDVTFNGWHTEMVDLQLTFGKKKQKQKKPHIALRPFDHLDYRCCLWTCWVNLTSVCLGTDTGVLVLQDTTQHIFHKLRTIYDRQVVTIIKLLSFMGMCTVFRMKDSYLNVFFWVFSLYTTLEDVTFDRWFAVNMVLKGWRKSWEHGQLLHKNKFKGCFQRRLGQPLSCYVMESFSSNFIRRKQVKMSDGCSLHSSIDQLL